MIVFMRIFDPIKHGDDWNEICAFFFWPLLFFYYIGFYLFHEEKGLLHRNVTRIVDFLQKDRTDKGPPRPIPAPPEQDQLKQNELS